MIAEPGPVDAPIDDEQLDRLLDAAMSVSPSPGFRARVAARIAAEPPPRENRGWLLWSGLAAATVALAICVTRPLTEAPDAHRPALDSAGAWTLSAVMLPAARVPPSMSVSAASPRRDTRAVRFDWRELEAFEWFREMASAAPVSTGVSSGEADLPSVPPLEIAPLDVSPIALTEGSEGEPHR